MSLEILPWSKNLSHNATGSGFVWKQVDFEVCNGTSEGIYTWAFCSSIAFFFGFPACVAVSWELFQRHRKGVAFTPNDVFVLNLTMADLGFLVFLPPALFNFLFWHNWPFEAFANFIFALNVCGRPLFMTCICLDCYLAVVHPITYQARKSLTPRVLMSVGVWVITVACGIAYSLFFTLYFSPLLIIPFIISITVIGICDFVILRTLKRSDPGGKGIHPMKKKAIQTIINSLVMILISYLPPTALTLIGRPLIASDDYFSCTVGLLVHITTTAGSAVMPILYLYNVGKLNHFRFGFCKNA